MTRIPDDDWREMTESDIYQRYGREGWKQINRIRDAESERAADAWRLDQERIRKEMREVDGPDRSHEYP